MGAVAVAAEDTTDKKLKVKKSTKMKDGSKKDPAKKKRKAEAAVSSEAATAEVNFSEQTCATDGVRFLLTLLYLQSRPLRGHFMFPPGVQHMRTM